MKIDFKTNSSIMTKHLQTRRCFLINREGELEIMVTVTMRLIGLVFIVKNVRDCVDIKDIK